MKLLQLKHLQKELAEHLQYNQNVDGNFEIEI